LEVSGQLHVPAALPPGKETPVPIGYEAGWASETDWTTCRGENLSPTGTLTPIPHPASQEPSRLLSEFVNVIETNFMLEGYRMKRIEHISGHVLQEEKTLAST
jgi:hypothetical protein